MGKIKIFGVGISGLVGSRIAEVLHENYIFENLSSDTGIDITNPATLDIIRKDTEHPIVLHLAAKADVDGCEKDKSFGNEGAAYKINVTGTENVVAACREGNKQIIYISTDFVFDGKNPPKGGYAEQDIPSPVNWYAETKYKGEEVVINSGIPYLVVRIAFPYRKTFELKKDFVRAIRDRLQNKEKVMAVSNQIITPTFIDDIAAGLDLLISNNQMGTFHLVGSEWISPYDAALKIAETFKCDKSLIEKISGEEFFKGRAPRPFNLCINNDKIKRLGAKMKTFEEGLKELI